MQQFTNQKQILNYTALIIIGILLFFGGMFCKTFDPIEVKGYKKECNDKLTMMRMMVMLKITDTGTLKEEQEKCSDAREIDHKIKKREHCRKESFGVKPINPADFKRHNQFLKCIQILN